MIDIPAARRLRDRAGIDLVACLIHPDSVSETFARLRVPRVARLCFRVVTGRPAISSRRAFRRVARWVIDFYPSGSDDAENSGPAGDREYGLWHGQQQLTDAWEWVERLLGVVGHDGHGLTLRELVHRFDGRNYHDFMICGHAIAAYYNSKRSRRNPRPARSWVDFHPMHGRRRRKPSGREQVDFLSGWFGARC